MTGDGILIISLISMNVSSMTTVQDSTAKCFAQLPSTPRINDDDDDDEREEGREEFCAVVIFFRRKNPALAR